MTRRNSKKWCREGFASIPGRRAGAATRSSAMGFGSQRMCRSAGGSAFARVRAKLLALPSKLAPMLAPEMTPAEAQAMLKDVVYQALNELGSTRATGISDDGEIIYTETGVRQ